MKLEKLVVDLDTARKLKEAGWSMETCFSWMYSVAADNYYVVESNAACFCPAPTTDELLDALSATFVKLEFSEVAKRYEATIQSSGIERFSTASETPQEALARLWLWCRENQLC